MSLKKGNITISGLGSAGADGYSPSANVSQSDDIITISITDKTGTTTANIDLSNKQDIMQYETLPTASASNEGQIVQYIGTTTNDYKNGYFYQCVSDEETTPTYSWENIEVQASGGGGDSYKQVYYLTTDFANTYNNIPLNATDIATLNKVIDDYRAGKDILLIAKQMAFYSSSGSSFTCTNVIGTITSGSNWISFTFDRNRISGERVTTWEMAIRRTFQVRNVGTPADVTSAYLPAISSPEEIYDLIAPKRITGYNATKTQVLKNINGTLTWVDE